MTSSPCFQYQLSPREQWDISQNSLQLCKVSCSEGISLSRHYPVSSLQRGGLTERKKIPPHFQMKQWSMPLTSPHTDGLRERIEESERLFPSTGDPLGPDLQLALTIKKRKRD